jgi:hypothetical protein
VTDVIGWNATPVPGPPVNVVSWVSSPVAGSREKIVIPDAVLFPPKPS